MDTETKQKIDKYVNNAFNAANLKENEAEQIETANVRENLASRGLAVSSVMDHEMTRIQSEKVNRLLKARSDALLDAYEIYNVPFDEDAILRDVAGMRETLIAAISNSAQAAEALMAVRTGRSDPGANIRSENFRRQLTIKSQAIANDLVCQIEQRRVMPKMRSAESGGVNISYHLSDNARINIQSTDQSVNTVTLTQEQLFTKIRDVITQEITGADQAVILSKLDELQQVHGTRNFSDKFTAFVASVADYMTIIGPFLPALGELAKKSLGG